MIFPTLTTQLIRLQVNQLLITLSDEQAMQLQCFLNLLIKWNRTYNLVSAKGIDQLMTHHLLDSLSIAPYLQAIPIKNLLDVGSGAGFPGIPLAILFPKIATTLIDSNQKKATFLQQVTIEARIKNIKIINDPVESFISEKRFDCIASRAFASLTKFVHLTSHLVATKGRWFAMKGSVLDETIKDLPAGVFIEAIHPLKIPTLNEERHLVILGLQS